MKYRLMIIFIIVSVILTGCAPDIERKFEGNSPYETGVFLIGIEVFPYGGEFIEVDNKRYGTQQIEIQTLDELSDQESLSIEKELGGTFCGGDLLKDVYFYDLCIWPYPKNIDQLNSLIEKAKNLDSVHDAKPAMPLQISRF